MHFLRKIKDYVLPHSGNNHKPLLLCEEGIAVLLVAVLLVVAFSQSGKILIQKKSLTASVQSLLLVDLANEDRAENNIPELSINPLLVQAAQLKANDMAENSYFAHTSPTGVTPWYWFGQAGYTFIYAGENLAVNYTESIDVDRAWMESPTHRANILNGNFTEIGIATSEGIYKGKKTTFVVQMFGSPKVLPVAKKVEAPKPVDTETLSTVPPSLENEADVLGEATEEVQLESVDVLYANDTYISVKNVETAETTAITPSVDETDIVLVPIEVQKPTPHTAMYERIFGNSAYYSRIAIMGILALVSITLLLMVVIEIRKQHYKNILYGVLVIAFLVALLALWGNLTPSTIVL